MDSAMQEYANTVSFGLLLLLALVASFSIYRARYSLQPTRSRAKTSQQQSVPASQGAGTASSPKVVTISSTTTSRLRGLATRVKDGVGGRTLVVLILVMLVVVTLWHDAVNLEWVNSLWSSRPVWLLISILLIGLFFLIKSGWRWVIGFLFIALLVFGAREGVDSFLEGLDRRINHGDWSEPSGSLRNVVGGKVRISEGGFDRFRASGLITLVNKSDRQCMNPQVSTPHMASRTGQGWTVHDIKTNELIYTQTWSRDGREYYVNIAPGRTEVLTITTIPLGQRGCAPQSM